jgi:hypothetical protein
VNGGKERYFQPWAGLTVSVITPFSSFRHREFLFTHDKNSPNTRAASSQEHSIQGSPKLERRVGILRTDAQKRCAVILRGVCTVTGKKKGGRPGLPASPLFLFRGMPISLTEGG